MSDEINALFGASPESRTSSSAPSCRICQKGTLQRKHVPIFGSAGAALQKILVILGIISLLVGIGLLIGAPAAQSDLSSTANRAMAHGDFDHYSSQTDADEAKFDASIMDNASYEKPALIIGCVLIPIGIFVGCKKWKLVCESCGAATDAA
jgi:hypothetical protein